MPPLPRSREGNERPLRYAQKATGKLGRRTTRKPVAGKPLHLNTRGRKESMKRSRQKYAVVVGLVLAVSGSVMAEEKTAQLGEVVVTATRDEVPIEQVGSSISVITAKEIEQQQKRTVADALRMVPGLDVKSYNGAGSPTDISLRGAPSYHTLVLVDGVEVNDPSDAQGGYNFANLTTDNIERIEVLNGPQSTLYGSHAIGGIINIITKRGEGKMKAFLTAEGGSHYTAKETAGISGSVKQFQYLFNISRLDTDGISAANSKNGNSENDPFQNTTVSARFGIAPLNNLDVDIALRYSRSRADLDGSSYTPPYNPIDKLGYYSKTEQLHLKSEANLSLFKNVWDQKLGIAYSDSQRSYSDNSYYNGHTVKFDWQHIIHLHSTNDFTFGAEQKDEYSDAQDMEEKHASTTSVYFQDQIKLFDRWFNTLGVRVDDHNQFGTKATYRFTTAYLIKHTGTKLKGSYGTGFRSPSLFELYAPALPSYYFTGGNSNLIPESSEGWDAGFEQSLPFMRTTFGATWFRNEFKNMIRYMTDPVTYFGYYDNVARAHTQGLELTSTVQPIEDLSLKATYTYTETKDDTSSSTNYGKQMAYRPKNKLTFDANYSLLKKANINLGLVYVGTRYANDSNTRKMKDYLLVNLAGSYDVTKNLQVFGRVDNLFDRQYEEVAGYGTPGIGAYGGVKVSF